MRNHYETSRLAIDLISVDDAPFILELLNTEGWIQFIGDRNIRTIQDAERYIQRIIDNQKITYWTVRIQNEKVPAGVISFIKRDYLKYYDLGFAFLPAYAKLGYALEASQVVLDDLIPEYETVLATTIPANEKSIQLLKKLKFHFSHEMEYERERLHVYSFSPALNKDQG